MEGFQVPQPTTMDGEDHRMDDAPKASGDVAENSGIINGEDMASDTTFDSDGSSVDKDFPNLQMVHRRGLLPTGCCYDSRMKMHLNADFNPHTHHPEDPRRVHEIFKAFKDTGLVYTGPVEKMAKAVSQSPTKYMWRIPARPATNEEILLAHSRSHLEWVEEIDNMSTTQLRQLTKDFDNSRKSLYIGALSHTVARLSCGGAIDTCKAVVTEQVKNAFAVIRPPGHHAEHDYPMGFCFFNNVPVAVKVCQKDYPERCRKVLILDWDVHHGNGIQNIFYDDPNVLYISLHVYQDGMFYPGQPEGDEPDGGIANVGKGAGAGKNVNIGWHAQGMGDGEYLAAFQKIVMPIAQEFDPDLVVISAGFDAAHGDQLGGCHVTPECYAHMTHMLMSLANGKVAVALEGGYDLLAISASAVAVAKTLMGEPPPKMTIPPLNQEAGRMLNKVTAHHAPYWDCMRGTVMDWAAVQRLGGVSLVDYMRTAQRSILQAKHRMVPLYIPRERVRKIYENQVLVTPDIQHNSKIVVVLHDPPELRVETDHTQDNNNDNVEPQSSWVVDGVSNYIDWAVGEGFGVMDINVPGYARQPDGPYAGSRWDPAKLAKADLREQMLALMPFLWDNYLELSAADDIFLIGVGKAYAGIKELLLARSGCKDRISGIVSFVTGEIYSVKSEADDGLTGWYRANARLYVTNQHACWLQEDLKRKIVKKRFGDARRSPETGLNEMMATHAEEAQAWIMSRVEVDEDDTEGEGGQQGAS